MANLECILVVSKDVFTPARLLFWYPAAIHPRPRSDEHHPKRMRNKYLISDSLAKPTLGSEDDLPSPADVFAESLGCSASVLSDFLTPSDGLLGTKFEAHMNKLSFVGHSSSVDAEDPGPIVYNLVFVLRERVARRVVSSYHRLTQRLCAALRHEETRRGYLTRELQRMVEAHDNANKAAHVGTSDHVINVILGQSQLGRLLRDTCTSMKSTGRANLEIDGWLSVSFRCPSQELPWGGGFDSENAFHPKQIRPYHSLLLRQEAQELQKRLVLDSAPTLSRLIQLSSPLKTFEEMAEEISLPLSQVLRLAVHLVVWQEATIILPLCQTNVYVVNPAFSLHTLEESTTAEFAAQFAGKGLFATLERFSRPRQLSDHMGHLNPMDLLQMVQWLLRKNMILLLHTYVFLLPPTPTPPPPERVPAVQRLAGPRIRRLSERDSSGRLSPRLPSLSEDSPLSASAPALMVGQGGDGDDDSDGAATSGLSPPLSPLARPIVEALDADGTGSESGGSVFSPTDSDPPPFELGGAFPKAVGLLDAPQRGFHVKEEGEASDGNGSGDEDEESDGEDQFDIPAHLSPQEFAAAQTVFRESAESTTEDFSRFLRLARYFRGKHPLEEMMWRENMSRAKLSRTLDCFGSLLVQTTF